jgi:hypothetical protein
VQKTRGGCADGAYFPMSSGGPSGAVTGWLLVLGLAALGVVAFLVWPGEQTAANFKAITGWQMMLTVVGVLFLALAIRRLFRPKPKSGLGSFRYFDALHMWVVSPQRVEAVPLESLQDVDGTFYRGSNSYSKIVLALPTGRREFLIPGYDRGKVEFLVKFVHAMVRFRNSDDAGLRAMAQSSPALLAAVSARLARGENVGSLGDLPLGEEPPRPAEDPFAQNAQPRGGILGAFVPWLAAAAAGVLAIFLVPAVDRIFLDEYLYVNARRDADEKHSPTLLREYLSDPANVRHRDEAQTRINAFYDEAIARLKTLAEGKKVDEQMFQAVLALLDALKKADKPVVTVGFRGSQEPMPATDDAKSLEQIVYAAKLDQEPKLKSVEENSPEKTAILPLGETFIPANTKVRESVILNQLRESVKTVLDADILTLEPAPEPPAGSVEQTSTPMIEVAYHTSPSGGLYIYTSEDESEVHGLLRGYQIDWTITIRPPGVDKPYEYKVGSKPASNLTYKPEDGDPSWAPYAIILYSAFDDMSHQLIQDFAVDPPASPDSYNFSEVVHKPSN